MRDVFPNNMPEIISQINRTQKSLTVITDVAAYGHFSSPDNSREYIRALNDLNNSRKDVQIKILYYEPAKGKNKLKEQFATEIASWTAFMQGDAYLSYVRRHPNDVPKDADALLTQIIGAGEKLKTNLLGINPETKVITTTDDLQIFMWIRDGEEAMFSLHNYGPNTREDSFKSIDKRFITRLEAIADEEFKKAEGVPAPQPVHNSQGGGETGVTPTPLATPTTASLALLGGAAGRRVHTITSDNGREFAYHERIAAGLRASFYFARPYASWERGLNENTNGLVRQYFPKKSDFSKITGRQVELVAERLNNRPRKALGYKTPNEVFFKQSLVALQT